MIKFKKYLMHYYAEMEVIIIMGKLKKLFMGLMIMCVVMGGSISCWASSASLSHTITKTSISGTFSYSSTAVLKMSQEFVEQHSTTKQIYISTNTAYAVGTNTIAKSTRTADIGYNYIRINYTRGYIGSTLYGTLGSLLP